MHFKSRKTLEENYTVTIEWDSTTYIVIVLDWDYKQIQVPLSLPGYTKKSLKQFSHKQKKKQNQPYPSVPIKYGFKKQYSPQPSSAPLLDKKGKKFIQQVCGFFFVYRKISQQHTAVTNHRHRIPICKSN